MAGYEGLVEKRVFEMGPYRTVAGRPIAHVRVGYETIGRLNAARDNAILIIHFNGGTSHFAGRYRADDPLPGYWDMLVGPGRALDTDRYFLIAADSLCNVNVHDGVTVTTGPASIDPESGRPYGMRFPTIQVRDLVHVQKALLDSLGIGRLHAVIGASFGSMQSFEWAAAFPDLVERVIAVVPGAMIDDYNLLVLKLMRDVITADPAWRGGDYYDGPSPTNGLALALRFMMIHSLCPEWGEQFYARKWADPGRDPAQSFDHAFASTAWVEAQLAPRLDQLDPNHYLYIQRANELFVVNNAASLEEGLQAIRARTLLLPATSDRALPVEHARKIRDILAAQGTEVRYQEIPGPMGHLNGVLGIDKVAPAIARFLAE